MFYTLPPDLQRLIAALLNDENLKKIESSFLSDDFDVFWKERNISYGYGTPPPSWSPKDHYVYKITMENDYYDTISNRKWEVPMLHLTYINDDIFLQRHVNTVDSSGDTLLLWLCFQIYDYDDDIRKLIKYSADVNKPNKFFNTPLMGAAHRGKHSLVNLLIASGADTNCFNKNNESALSCTLDMGYTQSAEILLEAGCKKIIDHQGLCFQTPLIRATKYNLITMIILFIKYGCNLNLQDQDGNTALMHAVIKDNVSAVQILLAAGADTTIKNKDGKKAYDLLFRPHFFEEKIVLRSSEGALAIYNLFNK